MPAVVGWPSHSIVCLLEESGAKECLAHGDVVFSRLSLEAQCIRHRFENHATERTQHFNPQNFASLSFL